MSLEIDKIKALLAKKNQKDYDSGLVSVDDDMDVIDNTHKFNAMSVTEKMMYPAKLTKLVLAGFFISVMVFGSAGIGKTYSVMQTLSGSGRTWYKTTEE